MDYSATPNYTDYNYTEFPLDFTYEMQPVQIIALVCYGLVILLGVPGNGVVVWVTGFCMPHTVTSLWFLNLAVADLLCCLSLPLLMVPLVHDDHWHFGPLACTLVKSLFYMVMYCSVLQLVLISLDRYLLVSKPVWCQNKRRPKAAVWVCLLVWCLALLGSIPQFFYYKQIEAGEEKRECATVFTNRHSPWIVVSFRFIMGFILPFLVIAVCHWKVYIRTNSGLSQVNRSKRMFKVIAAVIFSFFLCWIPLHIIDFILLKTLRSSPHRPTLAFAHSLALCLAYFNSCLNPLLYVCLGRGFKNRMSRSLRSVLHFVTEEPQNRTSVTNDTRSSTLGRGMTKV